MHHDVEYTNEFRNWWDTLTESEQDDVAATVGFAIEIRAAVAISLLLGCRNF